MQTQDFRKELSETANGICAPGKGILAADESPGTILSRFNSIGVENTEENRRIYRQLLVNTPGLNQYISGVIFHEETMEQLDDHGVRFVDSLRANNILVGIKLDTGMKPITGT
jgi:fructose-bisphosphate aldolase, class I